MCGIIGIILANKKNNVRQEIVTGLTMLQHRGQDSAGMITSDGDRINLCKNEGLVNDVFNEKTLSTLPGYMGIGHCRYPSAAACKAAEAQPFYTNTPYGIAVAQNGNLINAGEVVKTLKTRHTNTNSDSELIMNIFADEILNLTRDKEIDNEIVFEAASKVMRLCKGAYAVVAMIHGFGIVGFRDSNGIRPVCYGKRENNGKIDYCISSESVSLDILGYELIDDILPGECIICDNNENLIKRQVSEDSKLEPCIFEYVYIARPDSIIDHVSVHQARKMMGVELAKQIKELNLVDDIDIVSPVPETSRCTALSTAECLGKPYTEGLVKNRYVARTFIMPGQSHRINAVRMKLNPLRSEIQGKRVLLIDDSIVRGTTSKEIIEMLRSSGAAKVYFGIASPPVLHPNVYGIDMPTHGELIAYNKKDSNEIAHSIGADWIVYQKLEGLKNAVKSLEDEKHKFDGFDCSCFDGIYCAGNNLIPRVLSSNEVLSPSDEIYNNS